MANSNSLARLSTLLIALCVPNLSAQIIDPVFGTDLIYMSGGVPAVRRASAEPVQPGPGPFSPDGPVMILLSGHVIGQRAAGIPGSANTVDSSLPSAMQPWPPGTLAPVDQALGANQSIWFADPRRVREFRLGTTGAVSSFQTPANIHRFELDADGTVWLALDNVPSSLLGRRTAAGVEDYFVLPSSVGVVSDLSVRGSGSQVDLLLVSEDNPRVSRFDRDATLVDTLVIPGATGLRQVRWAPNGHLDALDLNGGIWRVDPATGVAVRIEERPDAISFGYDMEGGIWSTAASQPTLGLPLRQVRGPDPVQSFVTSGTVLDNRHEWSLLPWILKFEPDVDHDGDGFLSGEEIAAGSSPLEPQSRPDLDLDLDYDPATAVATLHLRGRPRFALVVIEPQPSSIFGRFPVPGIQGGVLLTFNRPTLSIPTSIPSTVEIPIGLGSTVFSAQALAFDFPAMGLELSDVERFRVSRD